MTLLNIFQLISGAVALYYGAEFLINGGVRIARGLGVSPLIIGLTLISFATSAPELTVSINAALQNQGDIAIGNVVGSNICNITLILGIAALLTPMPVHRQILRVDAPIMLAATLLLSAIAFTFSGVSRYAGGLLFGFFVVYTAINIIKSKAANTADSQSQPRVAMSVRGWLLSIVLIIGGLGLLVLGGDLLLKSAISIGRWCGLSEAVIALTIVAVGTSLPELATSVIAAIKKEQDIAIGNIIGSNIFNTLVIAGIAPLVKPFTLVGIIWVDYVTMIAFSLLLIVLMATGRRLNRFEGAVLLLLFAAYTAYLVIR